MNVDSLEFAEQAACRVVILCIIVVQVVIIVVVIVVVVGVVVAVVDLCHCFLQPVSSSRVVSCQVKVSSGKCRN